MPCGLIAVSYTHLNPTYHSSDITVEVSLLDQYGRQGFELTAVPFLANGNASVARDADGNPVLLRYPTNIPYLSLIHI